MDYKAQFKTGPRKCQKCNEEFRNEWGLRVHMSRRHKETAVIPVQPTVKPRRQRLSKKMDLNSTQKKLENAIEICYCPRCGLALKMIEQAISIINRAIKGDQ